MLKKLEYSVNTQKRAEQITVSLRGDLPSITQGLYMSQLS